PADPSSPSQPRAFSGYTARQVGGGRTLVTLLAMDNTERTFLETMSRALVSLPFDLKILLEAVADSDLERGAREVAAGTVVHVITPKDGNVDAPLRFAEDVVQLRLALAKIA